LFFAGSLLPACCESKKEERLQELKQDVQEISSFASSPTNSADIPSKMTGPYAATVQRDSQAASDEPKAVLEFTRPIPSSDWLVAALLKIYISIILYFFCIS